jgi:peptidoglycan/LPS O-acetylase OafA/YrhL
MGSQPRTHALDGLRGIAALAVVGFHVWLYRPERTPGTRTSLGDQLFFELHLGLICFFVLSGFLLYRGLLRRPNLKRYALRRIARIVPAYYVSIAGCLVLFAALGLDDLVPPTDSLPVFLAFGQNYFSDTLMEINPVTWTLCVEAAFYVALPLVALVRSGRARVTLLLSLIGATLVWNALT